MPLECALYYNDAQGIKGSNPKGGRPDSSAVLEFNHEVTLPVDTHTGLGTGHRVHGPVTILKELDAASPLLYAALCKNDDLPELQFKWYKVVDGVEQEYYTHTLRHARVIGCEDVLPNSKDPEQAHLPHVQRVKFAYEEMEWTWLDGGLMHLDGWKKSA